MMEMVAAVTCLLPGGHRTGGMFKNPPPVAGWAWRPANAAATVSKSPRSPETEIARHQKEGGHRGPARHPPNKR